MAYYYTPMNINAQDKWKTYCNLDQCFYLKTVLSSNKSELLCTNILETKIHVYSHLGSSNFM